MRPSPAHPASYGDPQEHRGETGSTPAAAPRPQPAGPISAMVTPLSGAPAKLFLLLREVPFTVFLASEALRGVMNRESLRLAFNAAAGSSGATGGGYVRQGPCCHCSGFARPASHPETSWEVSSARIPPCQIPRDCGTVASFVLCRRGHRFKGRPRQTRESC